MLISSTITLIVLIGVCHGLRKLCKISYKMSPTAQDKLEIVEVGKIVAKVTGVFNILAYPSLLVLIIVLIWS